MLLRLFRNRWVRGTALTVFMLLAVVLLISVSGYYRIRGKGERHQAQVLADLDATDPGWRFEQMQAARQASLPPPELNVIEQAVKLADRFPEEPYRKWQKDWPSLPAGTDREPPAEVELTYCRTLTDLCRDLIPEARKLRHLSGGVVVPLAENPLATVFPHLDKASRVAVLLQNDATVSAAGGKIDDALDDVLAMLAIARGLDDEPYIISHLFRLRFLASAVRTMERALRMGEASDAKLAEVQAALSGAAKVRGYVTALRGERAGMSKLADLLAKDPGQADGLIDPGEKRPPKAAVAVAASALLPEAHARYLELMTRAITVAEKPPGPERNAEFAQIDTDLKADASLEGDALRLVFPAIVKSYDAEVRTVALLDAAAYAIRLEQMRLHTKLKGHHPEGFWLKVAHPPADPFTGKRLLYKEFDDGVAVYSTGPDKTDDGGTNLTDGGTKAGSDWGVRLYDGKKRK
jgi:hypothetical protein